jgi:DNA polymerase
MRKVNPTGPQPAPILIVGEAPGKSEEEQGVPFVGGSGQLLSRLLSAAGFDRSYCRITNVVPYRPPGNDITKFFLGKAEAKKAGLADPELEIRLGAKTLYPTGVVYDGLLELEREIELTQPKLIIPLGNVSLWAITGMNEPAISKRAGSIYQAHNAWVVPTIHPASVLRQMEQKNIVVNDLKRAKRQLDDPLYPPNYRFTVFPTFHETIEFLDEQTARTPVVDKHSAPQNLPNVPLGRDGEHLLACDIETTARHEIGCLGFATSELDAFCIPFIGEDGRPYWTVEDEIEIGLRVRRLLGSANTRLVGQNFAFDAQYLAKNFFSLPNPRSIEDTMVGHHLCYPGTPKGLDYLSRLYLPFHVYWKDEGKFIDEKRDLRQWFEYNCKDCCSTFAVWRRISEQLKTFDLVEQYRFQMDMWHRALRVMLRGVRVNQQLKTQFLFETSNRVGELDQEMQHLSEGVISSKGSTPWWHSPTQSAEVFYKRLGYPVQIHKKTKRPSVDDDALTVLRKKDPLLWPIVDRILAIRSLSVFNKNFLSAGLGRDQRLRCTYDLTGTESFRLASRKDAFGGGTNLQNIPRLRK